MSSLFSPNRRRPSRGATASAGLPTLDELRAAPARYLEAALPIVDDVIEFHCFRGRLGPDAREDFRSWVLVKLIENDYGRLRKFEGRSSFRSFVTVVVGNLLLDYWYSKRGRRRPSSAAKLYAPEGMWLESYLRQGYTTSEAIRLVSQNHASELSEDELYHITLHLPERGRPVRVPEFRETLVGSYEASPERLVETRSRDASRTRLESTLAQAVERLSPDERVYVRMRFEEGSRINEIAAAFRLPEKAFYRRFQKTLRRLRRDLEALGVDADCLDVFTADSTKTRENFRARTV